MNIAQFKETHLSPKTQIIKLDSEGSILESDNTLFELTPQTPIQHLDPFFETLPLLEKSVSIPCINVTINDQEFIFDLSLHTQGKDIFLIVYDFTKQYQESHPLVQEKNEVAIAKYKLDFERKLLLAKQTFKDQFIAHFNHELRNPLNSLLGFLDILLNSNLNYEQKEVANLMHRNGNNLKALINDILDISKIENGTLSIKNVGFNLSALLKAAIKQTEIRVREKDVEVLSQFDEDLPNRIFGDPIRLNQILVNILDNASKNTHQGTIQLKVSIIDQKEDSVHLQFIIEDTGKGISQEDLPKIFDNHYQVALEQEQPLKGGGMGLTICKKIVHLLEGSIDVTSELGKGTKFKVVLPFEIPEVGHKRKKKTVPKGSGIIKGRRVLVVEDELNNQMLLMKHFIKWGEFQVDIAKDGEDAITLLEQKKYQIVLLNLSLPKIGGKEVIHFIRNHSEEHINTLKILVMSGNTITTEIDEILELGANGFLPKPFTQRELFERLTLLQ